MRFFRFCASILFLLMVAGIAHVWVSFQRTKTAYSLVRLKGEMLHIEEYNRKLKLEIAFLKSPENLETKAIEEFGLRHPSVEQMVFLP
jgi:cell division protein FtsL